jgi:hypothetical protein
MAQIVLSLSSILAVSPNMPKISCRCERKIEILINIWYDTVE